MYFHCKDLYWRPSASQKLTLTLTLFNVSQWVYLFRGRFSYHIEKARQFKNFHRYKIDSILPKELRWFQDHRVIDWFLLT